MCRLLAVVAALMLSGCSANFKSIYRAYNANPNGGTTNVLIDAKQRAIISMPNPKDNADRAAFVCAEPSPDTLAVISAALSGGFKGRQSELTLAGAITETAKELGRRNATIQLLRDGLYRQCEAYMNGLIGPIAYESIANKYINAMVVLLAIEEITPELNTDNGEESGSNGPTGAEANVSSAGGGDGNSEQELPEAEPSEQSDQNDTDGGEAPDESDPATAASSGKPVVETAVQGGNADVSEAVAKEVSEMAQAFLRRDTLNYCLYMIIRYEVGGDFVELCKAIVQNEYQRQSSDGDPPELTETEVLGIINEALGEASP